MQGDVEKVKAALENRKVSPDACDKNLPMLFIAAQVWVDFDILSIQFNFNLI